MSELLFCKEENQRLKNQITELQEDNRMLRATLADKTAEKELKSLKAKTQSELAEMHHELNKFRKVSADYEMEYAKSQALVKQYKTEMKQSKALVTTLKAEQESSALALPLVGVPNVVIKEVAKEITVEKIVERIVERPVDLIVEKIVEVEVERLVEVPVEKLVEVTVEKGEKYDALQADNEKLAKKLKAVSAELVRKGLEVNAFRNKLKEIGQVMLAISETKAEFKTPGGET